MMEVSCNKYVSFQKELQNISVTPACLTGPMDPLPYLKPSTIIIIMCLL